MERHYIVGRMGEKQTLGEIAASVRRLRVQVQSAAELSGSRRVMARLSLVDRYLEEIAEALERFAAQQE